jgi:N6-L-threonylcarbamoyladenine synthase
MSRATITILALETSCDETAVAILRGRDLLASEVASQIAEHEQFGGVVPEVASRNHLVHAPRLLERATRDAKIKVADVDAFAATSGPGLASSLMIGASIAKGLAIGFGKPYLAINHLEGHLLSPFFGETELRPNVALIVSGGHTLLIHARALDDYRLIGRTVDDAAGEAFDKVAKLLGLRYPGGPEIEKLAREGNPKRFDLPRSMLNSENFSFSGLKTSVRYLLAELENKEGPRQGSRAREAFRSLPGGAAVKLPTLAPDLLSDLCASFQQAIIDVLVHKTIAAARSCAVELVTLSGGVSCNKELRRQLRAKCKETGLEFKAAEPSLCTDNAAMIAFAALQRLQAGLESGIAEEIDPNLAVA